ncbi:MAG: carbohydrate ABC transporter permease [Candidatus Sumerlaeia bacterium]
MKALRTTESFEERWGSRTPAGVVARYAVLIILVGLFIGPFFWMVSIAVRGSGSIYELELIPDEPTLMNFVETWKNFGFARAFVNSVIVAVCTVGLNVLFSSLAAYPLARLRFPGANVVFFLILSTLMIPFQLYMVPLFLLARDLHLINTLTGIILPGSVGAFGVFMIKQYYSTIPRDLEEAARIDGAGEFGIWARIMLPLTQPAVAAMAIFIFVGNWSSFLWPLIIINSEDKYTLPIAVAKLSGAFIDKTQYIAAGSVIAVAPVIILFFFLQRYFIGGLTLGAVKG